jgi:hypothetical protein
MSIRSMNPTRLSTCQTSTLTSTRGKFIFECIQYIHDIISIFIADCISSHKYTLLAQEIITSNRIDCITKQRLNNIVITYLLTPWSRVLPEKLTGLQLVKKFPPFYGTRRFITALTSARHLSLSWANPIQSSHPHPTSWRSILHFNNFMESWF